MENSTREKLNRKLNAAQKPAAPVPTGSVPDPNTENPIMKLISENPYASITALVIAIVTVLTYVLSLYGINLPAEVIAAITAILSFLLGRWTRLSGEEAKKLGA